jgi:hypothetical protein
VERDAPLVVYTDAIAQRGKVLQLLKVVADWDAQINEIFGAIELAHLPTTDVLNIRRQLAAALAEPDAFGFCVGEGSDHEPFF